MNDHDIRENTAAFRSANTQYFENSAESRKERLYRVYIFVQQKKYTVNSINTF